MKKANTDNREKIKDFHEAWRFLNEHKAFSYMGIQDFRRCLSIEVVKVNPKTKSIDDNQTLNSETNVWLECGDYEYDDIAKDLMPTHDIRLDCGAKTFEQAIIKLANLVRKCYGEHR